MYTAKDLKHQFEIEPLVDEFVQSVGGQLIKTLVPASPEFKNADYLFRNNRVVIELKSLQEDFAIPDRLQEKIIKLWEKWISEGTVEFGTIFRPSELPVENRRQVQRLYSEPIRRVLKKANRQLRSTAEKLGIRGPRNLLMIANDGLYSLEPDFIIATIAHLLQREFSSIHGFVYFTANRYVEMPEDDFAHHLWIPAYSESAANDLVDFVDNLGSKWFDFLGDKIGGWEGPQIKTDDRSFIKGVRNITP